MAFSFSRRGGVRDQAKAVIFYQGEYEALTDNGYIGYAAGFNQLYQDWKNTYPGLKKIYVFQINSWAPAGSRVREVQRHFHETYPDVEVVATVGSPGYAGHYTDSGYNYLGDRISRLVKRDVYPGTDDTLLLSSPNLVKAYFSSPLNNEISLLFNQPVLWKESDGAELFLKNYFFVNDSPGLVDSGWSIPNEGRVCLKLTAPIDTVRLTYIKNETPGFPSYSSDAPEPFLRNPTGIAATTFDGVHVEVSGPSETQSMTSLRLLLDTLYIEQYLQTTVRAEALYSGGWRDTNNRVYFSSLDTALIRVSFDGMVTARNPGLSQIVAEKNGYGDTLFVSVIPSTAVTEAIFFKKDTIHLLVNSPIGANLTARYQKDGKISFVRCDTLAIFSANTGLIQFQNGQIEASSSGGPWKVVASLGSAICSVMVVVHDFPSVIRKINFQAPGSWITSLDNGWVIDSGGAFNIPNGYGWLEGAYSYNLVGDNYLEDTYAIVSSSVATGATFKIDAPDGDYLIKLCNWAEYYLYRPIMFGADTLLLNSLAYYQKRAYVVRKIHVTGGGGCVIKVYGNICYLILISDNGAPMELFTENITLPQPTTKKETGFAAAVFNSRPRAFPNPFNASTVVRFGLPAKVSADYLVYNIRGQRLAAFHLSNEGTARERRLTIGDKSGMRLAAGLYYGRLLRSDGKIFSHRLLLVR